MQTVLASVAIPAGTARLTRLVVGDRVFDLDIPLPDGAAQVRVLGTVRADDDPEPALLRLTEYVPVHQAREIRDLLRLYDVAYGERRVFFGLVRRFDIDMPWDAPADLMDWVLRRQCAERKARRAMQPEAADGGQARPLHWAPPSVRVPGVPALAPIRTRGVHGIHAMPATTTKVGAAQFVKAAAVSSGAPNGGIRIKPSAKAKAKGKSRNGGAGARPQS